MLYAALRPQQLDAKLQACNESEFAVVKVGKVSLHCGGQVSLQSLSCLNEAYPEHLVCRSVGMSCPAQYNE